MTIKTTITIDQQVRRKLKKIASILGISQGEVIKRALNLFEKTLLDELNKNKIVKQNLKHKKIDIEKILEDATKKVWKMYPECKKIQKILQTGPESIDNFIITEWNSGLEN
ncbi:MAG: hypothetical protein ACTSYB_18315 [Candidatus Helarchaeota archaeon]